jgi:hypothetical protein
MKPHIALVALFAIAAAAAEFQRIIPHATWEPIFFESINALSGKVHWEPLRAAPVGADSLEVRVWIGFGRFPLEAFRLRREGSRWSAQHVIDTIEKTARARLPDVRPKSDWASVWRELDQLGLLTLPDSSSLPNPEVLVNDGESYVVEINTGNTYRTYQYGNPQFQRWPEAKKIIRIIEILHRELSSRE